jgi:site-specific DNA recombinase
VKNCVGYIRVSTSDQAREGVSLDAQRERLTAYCTMRSLALVEIISDEGVSGTVPLANREGGAKLLEMVRRRAVTEVAALKLDRLFRNAHDALGKMAEWDRANVGLHLIDMGGAAVDTRSAMGRMMLTMMAGFAQFERDLISERTAASLQCRFGVRVSRVLHRIQPLALHRVGRPWRTRRVNRPTAPWGSTSTAA